MQKGKAAKGSSQVKAAFSGFLPTRRWTVLTPIVWDEAIVASTFASLATLGSVTRVPCLILRSANSYAGNEANEDNWTYLPATLVQSDMTIAIGKIVLTYSNPFSHLAFGRCGWSMAHRVHMSLCILLALSCLQWLSKGCFHAKTALQGISSSKHSNSTTSKHPTIPKTLEVLVIEVARWKHSKLKKHSELGELRSTSTCGTNHWPDVLENKWRRLEIKTNLATSRHTSFCLEMSACGFSSQASRSTWWAMGKHDKHGPCNIKRSPYKIQHSWICRYIIYIILKSILQNELWLKYACVM